MHLIQLLLPVKGEQHADGPIAQTRQELVDRFQGVTAYIRAPARGAWVDPAGDEQHDDVVMVEVVVEEFDREWWQRYSRQLAARFDEEAMHIRVMPVELL
ncbi:MAG: hypothetical protein IT178_09395 [Acidobacteria bacterium]|nr:hypothetical protein [Acidobacteriota bacterium]